MTQVRIWNYGDTFTADKTKEAQKALNCSGVYSGFDITVLDTNKISLSADGYLLEPNGILISETSSVSLTIAVLPASSTEYTITCRHDDENVLGGTEAVYSIEVGNFAVGSLSNGVVIGWIHHPGGAAPLNISFIEQAPKNGCGLPAHSDTHCASGTDAIDVGCLSSSDSHTDYVLHPDGIGGVEWGPVSASDCTPCALGFLILKTDGGVVVDTGGNIVVKTDNS